MVKVIINENRLSILRESLLDYLSTNIGERRFSHRGLKNFLCKNVLKKDEVKAVKVIRYLKYLKHTKGTYTFNDIVDAIINYCVMVVKDGSTVKMAHYHTVKLTTSWED